jgi:hypothetical protein
MDKQNKIIMAIGAVVIIAVAIFAIVKSAGGLSNKPINTNTNFFEGRLTLEELSKISSCPLTADKDSFAKCLTEKNFVMYGAEWCENCKIQKDAFGDSFKYIKYVECPENTKLCLDKGIKGYPTWIKENQK